MNTQEAIAVLTDRVHNYELKSDMRAACELAIHVLRTQALQPSEEELSLLRAKARAWDAEKALGDALAKYEDISTVEYERVCIECDVAKAALDVLEAQQKAGQ